MSSYTDLTDNVDDTFTFSLRGNKYEMRYPRTSELEEIQTLNTRIDELSNDKENAEGNSAEIKDLNDKLVNSLYAFITPVEHDKPIKEALMEENVKVLKKFNVMIKTELAV